MGDSDVPPLEDMSALLHQVEALRESNDISSSNENSSHSSSTGILPSKLHPESQNGEEKTNTAKTSDTDKKVHKARSSEICKTNTKSASSSKTNSATFGGFKKGFFFGDSKSNTDKEAGKRRQDIVKKKPVVDKSDEESIPFIKTNTKENSNFQFTEVQQAMEASQKLLDKNDWLTDDLMTQIQQNETLSKRLADPSFVQAIAEFQKDPKAASLKYENNKEMQTFLTDFTSLMGSHFTKMAESKPSVDPTQGSADISVHDPAKQTPEDDVKVQDILADPELREILLDPKIQILFEMVKKKPEQVPGYLHSADNEMRMKIQKLVAAGLLQQQA